MKRLVVAVVATLLLASCDSLITSPEEGAIIPGGTVTVTGVIPKGTPLGGTLSVNGTETPVQDDRSWTLDIPASAAGTVTVVEAIYTEPDGTRHRQTSAVVSGPKVDAGQPSPDGVGMRFTNTGLADLGPVINDLAGGSFDISGMILAQKPLVEEENAFLTFDITGDAYEAGLGAVGIATESAADGVRTDITVSDLYIGLDLVIDDDMLINSRCRLELQIPTTAIGATFDLEPDAGDPGKVDVGLVGEIAVDTGTVDYEFISGICDQDAFLIGDIVDAVAGPQVQTMIASGFASQLGDPDGTGPADSPIADAIETALAEVSIAGPVGEAVHARLTAPFTRIAESDTGIDMRADADFAAVVGDGPAECRPPAGAPELAATFDVPGEYPALGDTTPSGDPYGLGLVISSSAFNQLLGAMTECGLLNQDITEIALGGTTLPVTSTVLAALVPELGTELPPNTPMAVRLDPYVAPFLSGKDGPGGEQAELMLADLHIDFIQPGENGGAATWLSLAVDAPLGFELGYDEGAGELAPTITPPPAGAVDARVLANPLGADEDALEAVFPNLLPMFVNDIGSTFGSFPLPGFLGLTVDVVELAEDGGSYVLYADLAPVPATHIENVAVTDLSTPDVVVDSIWDVREWRHRIRKTVGTDSIRIDLDGMVGADACCTVEDEAQQAHAGYSMTFDVVPAPGETWQVDLSQAIAGAHTRIDEQKGGGSTKFLSPVTARARVGDGAWQSFDLTPSVGETSGNGAAYEPFTGSNALVLRGDTAQTVTLEVGFDVRAHSDSNIAFPAVSGDEAAIRFGANDTITNGFTAGEYPGVGDRDIVADGHVATVALTTVP